LVTEYFVFFFEVGVCVVLLLESASARVAFS